MNQLNFLSIKLDCHTALNAYARVKAWEKRESERNRQILVRFFGGSTCRQHNHILNCESGHERPEIVQFEDGMISTYKLGKLYNHRQAEIWKKSRRLSDHFAKFF